MRSVLIRLAAVLTILAIQLALPGAALAAPPPNDDITGATPITALPFQATEDTTQATAGADPFFCNAGDHTVWFTFTPATDVSVAASTDGSDYFAEVGIFSGTPGDLSLVACTGGSDVPANLTAGTQYYFLVSTFSGGTGGTLQFSLAQGPPALTFSFVLDDHLSADRFGRLFAGATVQCNKTATYDVFLSISERIGKHQATGFVNEQGNDCATDATGWTRMLISLPIAWKPGREALVRLQATATDGVTQVALPTREGPVPIRKRRR